MLKAKLAEYDTELIGHRISDDKPERVTGYIQELLDLGAELVLCSGGMSVDPDDRTPLAIRNTGADIVTYGAPVLPGAMFMLAYYNGNIPIVGLPGCVMYAKRTVFDLVLPRLMADEMLKKKIWIVWERADCVCPVRPVHFRIAALENKIGKWSEKL